MAFTSTVTVRFMERRAHRPVKELRGWSDLQFTKRARRVGDGSVTLHRDEVTSDVISLLANDNLAIYIRHEVPVLGVEGEASKGTTITTQFHGPVFAATYSSASEIFTFTFQDNLAYLNDRTIDTEGSATVDPGAVTCIAYCRSLLNTELISPTDGDRAIDIPAALDGLTAGGGTVDLPVRWGVLGSWIETALIEGDCYIEAPLVDNAGARSVMFRVKQVENQTEGSGGTIGPLSAQLTGSDVRFELNHAPVRNRYYVLGDGTGAARNVTTRTAATIKGRLREAVTDARHLTTTAERQALGDAMLTGSAETETRASVLNVERTMNVTPGMKVTLAERMAGDATQPDIGPVDVVVLAKTYRLTPESERISLEVGSEPRSMASVLHNLQRRTDASAFE